MGSGKRKKAAAIDQFGAQIPGQRFVEQAAAGLQTTIVDLAQFVAAGVNRNGNLNSRVLTPETVRTMQSAQPASSGYGLGYDLSTVGEHQLVGHTGANAGWMSGFQAIPAKGTGIVVLTNADNGQYIFPYLRCLWRSSQGVGATGSRCRYAAFPVLLGAWRTGGADGL